jgi:hypothetical protein
MRVLSHRGYWKVAGEKNTLDAFTRSASLDFGTETDVRDYDGKLVISHDPAVHGSLAIDEMLGAFRGKNLPLAINVKADGLSQMLSNIMNDSGVEWFVFDMSTPELYRYLAAGAPCYTRHSDIESHPVCYERSIGVWLDSFAGPEWYDASIVAGHLNAGKRVCVVSSELHGRPHLPLWSMLRDSGLSSRNDLDLCTDIPEAARSFFETREQ